MKTIFAASALILAGGSTLGIAAPTGKQCAELGLFQASTDMNLMLAKLKRESLSFDDQQKFTAELDSGSGKAMKGAATSTTLRESVKNFISTAKEYFENIAPSSGELKITYQARSGALQSRMDRAKNDLDLEMKQACP